MRGGLQGSQKRDKYTSNHQGWRSKEKNLLIDPTSQCIEPWDMWAAHDFTQNATKSFPQHRRHMQCDIHMHLCCSALTFQSVLTISPFLLFLRLSVNMEFQEVTSCWRMGTATTSFGWRQAVSRSHTVYTFSTPSLSQCRSLSKKVRFWFPAVPVASKRPTILLAIVATNIVGKPLNFLTPSLSKSRLKSR